MVTCKYRSTAPVFREYADATPARGEQLHTCADTMHIYTEGMLRRHLGCTTTDRNSNRMEQGTPQTGREA